jgi:hypothetical protein
MGIRESINQQNPKVVLGGTVGVLVIVATLLVLYLRSGGDAGGGQAGPPQAFFSIDEGKTWFTDDATKLPPFSKDGKNAFRAYVFKCGDGKPFVAFLERYTASGKKSREAAEAPGAERVPLLDQSAGVEVKAPGESNWVRQSDSRAMAIMTPKCPNGERAQMVLPP